MDETSGAGLLIANNRDLSLNVRSLDIRSMDIRVPGYFYIAVAPV